MIFGEDRKFFWISVHPLFTLLRLTIKDIKMEEKLTARYRIAEIIAKTIVQTATEDEKRKLQEWVDESPEHRRELDSIMKRLRKDMLEPHPADTAAQWKVFAGQLPSKTRWRLRLQGMARYAAAAAVLAAVLLIGALWWHPSTDKRTAALPIVPGSEKALLLTDKGTDGTPLTAQGGMTTKLPEVMIQSKGGTLHYDLQIQPQAVARTIYHTLKVPRGGEYRLILSDGTKIHLNSASQVTYPVCVSPHDSLRRVSVQGEAFFDVAHSDAQPFEVVMEDQSRVRVYGTRFNVHSYEEDDYSAVTLVQGSVDFTSPEGERLMLRPGEQAVYHRAGHRSTMEAVDASAYTSWIDGVFEFDSLPLEQIMRQLSRWYDVDYRFEDASLSKHSFTGVAYKHAPLQNLLKTIEKTTHIHFTIKDRTIIISD